MVGSSDSYTRCLSMRKRKSTFLLLVALARACLLQSVIWRSCGPMQLALPGVAMGVGDGSLRGACQGLSWA